MELWSEPEITEIFIILIQQIFAQLLQVPVPDTHGEDLGITIPENPQWE